MAVQMVLIVAVLVAILVAGTNGQSSTCTNAIISLSHASTTYWECHDPVLELLHAARVHRRVTAAVHLPGSLTVPVTSRLNPSAGASPVLQRFHPAGTPGTPHNCFLDPGYKNTPSTDSSGSSAIQSSLTAFLMLALVASYATAS
ncbi:hypothetical protein MLD38_018062 [Melastoma candidum]|uniref:Uncharacterized protein n=1 Tax=Melastoma candidum TaxID=119954 RepID=A0ACB9QUJ8_9MYRT|nr:hypothetical protein MLD38_018062 [Melastoma candidum]